MCEIVRARGADRWTEARLAVSSSLYMLNHENRLLAVTDGNQSDTNLFLFMSVDIEVNGSHSQTF